jgi:hypothetical protein
MPPASAMRATQFEARRRAARQIFATGSTASA